MPLNYAKLPLTEPPGIQRPEFVREEGSPALLKRLHLPLLSPPPGPDPGESHELLRHTDVPAQKDSGRATGESLHHLSKPPGLTPTHPGTAQYSVCGTIVSCCQVNSQALFENSGFLHCVPKKTLLVRSRSPPNATTTTPIVKAPLQPLWPRQNPQSRPCTRMCTQLMPWAPHLPRVFPLSKVPADLQLLHTRGPLRPTVAAPAGKPDVPLTVSASSSEVARIGVQPFVLLRFDIFLLQAMYGSNTWLQSRVDAFPHAE